MGNDQVRLLELLAQPAAKPEPGHVMRLETGSPNLSPHRTREASQAGQPIGLLQE